MPSTVITPRRTRISLPVPSSFIGKRVAVTFVIIDEEPKPASRLSDKFRGVFSSEDARSFNEHTQTMRSEWTNI